MRSMLAAALLILPLGSSAWAKDHFSLQRSSFPGDTDVSSPEASACPNDAIVWINLRSGVYYGTEDHAFGRTIQGAYMCRKAANEMGYAEKHAEQ